MRGPGGLRHWLGLTLLLLLVAVPSTATAATTVRTLPATHYLVQQVVPLAAPPVTVGAHALLLFRFTPGYAAAGVQGIMPGLQGTTVVLASCGARCTDHYRPASSPAIVVGDYAERVTFTVTQPGNAGTAVGFDLEIGVHTNTGWVFGMGYFSTGLGIRAAAATITLLLYVSLGTVHPTVLAVEVTVNRCLSTTGCP